MGVLSFTVYIYSNPSFVLLGSPMTGGVMCGRFAQYKIAWEYLDPIGLDVPLLSGISPEPIGRYNVAPTSKVQIIHQNSDGLLIEPLPWGYARFWAQGKRP